MSGFLIVIVIAAFGLLVLGIVVARRAGSRRPSESGGAHVAGAIDGTSTDPSGLLAGGLHGSPTVHGGPASQGPHAAMDYSTNDFSGPDPASDAGVSFGDCGGGDAGGGGDGGGGGGD